MSSPLGRGKHLVSPPQLNGIVKDDFLPPLPFCCMNKQKMISLYTIRTSEEKIMEFFYISLRHSRKWDEKRDIFLLLISSFPSDKRTKTLFPILIPHPCSTLSTHAESQAPFFLFFFLRIYSSYSCHWHCSFHHIVMRQFFKWMEIPFNFLLLTQCGGPGRGGGKGCAHLSK